MKVIRETCIPRREVLKGDLEDAIFAADFGHVVVDRAPDVYNDPTKFFRNTHPAAPLRKVITTIFERLADPNEAGAAVRLSTGFGGGKTHTLIALWHLARNITQATLGTELLPAAGRPQNIVVAGIDAQKFGTAVCASHPEEGIETHSLWGELAFQLGGPEGYAKMQAVDDPTTVPHDAAVRAILPDAPVLILLDELVIYMALLGEQAQGALLSFLSKLIAEVGARRQAVVVITDPAKQPAYHKEAQALADVTKQLEAAQRLDDVLGRKMSDFDPIGTETAQVINRRLFEQVDQSAAEVVSAEYYNAYQRVASEYPDLLPPEAATKEYAGRIVECYPFHPRLLETAQDRLGALQDFNKSRGTLRLFARILRDVWDSASDVPLITAGDLNWQSERIQADLLQRLNRDNFMPAVNADVARHASRLDADYDTDVHRRVATALLLESLPLAPGAAMDKRDLTLAVLRPSDVGHEPGEAIDRLMNDCWHTYKNESGRKFQFRYEPNANKIIEERIEGISIEDARQAVMTLAQDYFSGHTLTLVAWPASPRAVSDSAALQLVLCETEQLAQAVCSYEDDADPDALRPRRFRNAIFGIAPTPATFDAAVQHMRRRMAADEVAREHKKKTALRQQVDELLPTLRKKARFRAVRAFNRVVFQGKPSVTLDERYLVSDEGALGSVSGQAQLKTFLDDNKYIYQPAEAVDVDLLLDLMSGATPSLDHEGAYPTSAVHERTLASPKLRLMLNQNPVRDAVLKGVKEGKLAVHLHNGDAYDQDECVTGIPGNRTRVSQPLTTLTLTADVLVAPTAAPCVADWLREDQPVEIIDENLLTAAEAATQKQTSSQAVLDAMDLGQIDYVTRDAGKLVVLNDRFHNWQPSTPPEVSAYDWGTAIQYAAQRPLLSLRLKASSPPAAGKLIACAQPFGAQSLTLSVRASGLLKDGGQVNFAVSNVKHNTPLKPIDVAKKLLRATQEGSTFSAELVLDFGGIPIGNTAAKFEQAQAQAVDGVGLEARFGAESESE